MKTITQEQARRMTFERHEKDGKVFWIKNKFRIGLFQFTFDKRKIFNLFSDYPMQLNDEERKIFAKENPFWVHFFRDRF